MKSKYRYEIVLYWSEEDDSYIAEVPELAGCAADGSTYEQALANVEVVTDEAEEVIVSVSTSSAGFLVLSDLFYPGWRAFIADREIEIYRANYLFRAVEVEVGRSEVRFVYEPESYRVGWLVSGLTFVFLTAGFIWAHRRSTRSESVSS